MNYIMQTYCIFIRKLGAFYRLENKCQFIYVYLLSGMIRLSMLIIPFKYFKKYLGIPKKESPFELSEESLEIAKQLRRLVLQVCRYTPWESKCLVRAILGAHLLKRKGIESTLYLGVNKNVEGEIQAHAWLRVGERIIMGGENKSDFVEVAKFYKY